MFYHQCLCSPPKSTLLKALKNSQLKSFSGLTYELIAKCLPLSTATKKGYLVQKWQGVQSIWSNFKAILDAQLEVHDMNPDKHVCSAEDSEMFCSVFLVDAREGTIYSNLSWRFPIQSYSDMQYIFGAYFYGINAIIMQPITSPKDASMVTMFKDIYETLKSTNCWPHLHVLDNKFLKACKNYIKSKNCDIQLVKSHNHRFNAA